MRTPLCVTLVAGAAFVALAAGAEPPEPKLGATAPPPATANPPRPETAAAGDRTASAAGPSGRVERAAFTLAVIDREPAGEIDALTGETGEILFFTELRELQGQTVVHRWRFQGETVAEVPFQVGGPRWRVHSSKRLLPDWAGEWTVEVVDEAGRALRRESFLYDPAAPVAEVAPPARALDPAPTPVPAVRPRPVEPVPLPASLAD